MEAFLDYIKFEKRYSPHTLVAYQNDLEQFSGYLKQSYEVDSLNEVTHVMVRSWIVELMDEKVSPRSVNRKLSSLKSYYRFALRQKQIKSNPMSKVVSPKTSKRLPEFVEARKMEALLDDDWFSDDFSGVRDQLLMELLYGTGVRLSEVIGLREVNCSSDTIKVLGKRNKERIIPVSEGLSQLITKYRLEKQNLPEADREFLMVTDKGNKLYEKFVYRKVNKYLGKVTTARKKSPHVLRHTFATHMLNNGADLNAIKELLGHANLSATQVYTHNTIDQLKNIYSQAHPRAQKK